MLLSACAHTPDDGSLKGPMEEPLGVAIPPVGSDPSTAVPPAETSGTYPEQPVPGRTVVRGADGEASAMEPKPVVGLTPTQYSDLFDRIRAGFKFQCMRQQHGIDGIRADGKLRRAANEIRAAVETHLCEDRRTTYTAAR